MKLQMPGAIDPQRLACSNTEPRSGRPANVGTSSTGTSWRWSIRCITDSVIRCCFAAASLVRRRRRAERNGALPSDGPGDPGGRGR